MSRNVWLPGFACESWIWRELVLAHDPDGIFVDWPEDRAGGIATRGALASWAIREYLSGEPDLVLIGHSMGGVASVDIAQVLGARVKQVVLVESFLTSPGPFFQNLLMESTPTALRRRAVDMLQRGKQKASPALRESLQKLDYTEKALHLHCRCSAVYGDRGFPDRAAVVAALNWPPELLDRIPIQTVPNSCHFPMLENPQAVLQFLRDVAVIV